MNILNLIINYEYLKVQTNEIILINLFTLNGGLGGGGGNVGFVHLS